MDKNRETVSGQTMPPYVDGKTGRIYFNYAVGAKYEVYNYKTYQNYVLEVQDCAYLGGREYYTVARDGRPFVEPCSANRLRFLLTYDVTATQTEEGERREIPLTLEEVRQYFFDWYISDWQKNHREALQKVQNTDYKKIIGRIGYLSGMRDMAESTQEAVNFALEILDLEQKRREILISNKVDEYYLRDEPRYNCKQCSDTGISNGAICDCAIVQTIRIKEHCGKLRLKKV